MFRNSKISSKKCEVFYCMGFCTLSPNNYNYNVEVQRTSEDVELNSLVCCRTWIIVLIYLDGDNCIDIRLRAYFQLRSSSPSFPLPLPPHRHKCPSPILCLLWLLHFFPYSSSVALSLFYDSFTSLAWTYF